MVDNNKIFNSIKDFVFNLNECYGDNYTNISLYNNLLQKTTNFHTEAIAKNNEIFRRFCLDNEICILNKNYNLSVNRITFSEKMYIDISEVFSECCDDSEKEIIWKHIALIYSYFKPSTHLKDMLTTTKKTNESNFLQDMIGKVEDTLDGGGVNNPMEAITKMMTSGVFTELVGNMTNGLQSGELNIGGLLGSVNDMVDTMNINTPTPIPTPTPTPTQDSKIHNDTEPIRTNRNKKRKKLRRK
jgi:hypothetical protein